MIAQLKLIRQTDEQINLKIDRYPERKIHRQMLKKEFNIELVMCILVLDIKIDTNIFGYTRWIDRYLDNLDRSQLVQ